MSFDLIQIAVVNNDFGLTQNHINFCWFLNTLFIINDLFLFQLTPEEEERRRMRRERNKFAAAKCRQKRVDLTNQLLAVSCLLIFLAAVVGHG